MIPMALAVGLDIGEITKEESRGVIPSRHQINSKRGQTLAADEVYIGHGHHSHRQPTSKWASPFIPGQHGTAEDCLHTSDQRPCFRKSAVWHSSSQYLVTLQMKQVFIFLATFLQ